MAIDDLSPASVYRVTDSTPSIPRMVVIAQTVGDTDVTISLTASDAADLARRLTLDAQRRAFNQ